jgi:hypothetical protein
MAESEPKPIKNKPTPTIYKLVAIPFNTIPNKQIPYANIIDFFLPQLSVTIDTDIYPKKHPTYTKEANKSDTHYFPQCKSSN